MERRFVDWLRERLPPHPLLKLGVGDDAALLAIGDQHDAVVTTDMLADGVHFLRAETDARLIGRKCLAVNLSDLAAMAAEPVAAVVSLLLPSGVGGDNEPDRLAQRLIEGMLPLAEEFNVAIAGGDTNTWDGRLAVSVTAIGRVDARGPLTRTGAVVGDRLLVTGGLGGSLEGWHLGFEPRVREAWLLRERYQLNAGMDITDGLSIDLDRLCRASRVGAVVWGDHVPVSPSAERLALASGDDALDRALNDGEDFELLLTAPADIARAIVADQPFECGVTEIGEVVANGLWIDRSTGGRHPLLVRGYEHR